MKRHAAKALESKIKTNSFRFQEKMQDLLNFNIQADNDAISKYIRELQGKIELEEALTHPTNEITTNITSPIEGNIDRVNKLSNLIQDLRVNYHGPFRQFSEFCNNFYNLGLNKENVQQAQILAEIAGSLELEPIKLESWLTGVSSQNSNSNDTTQNNDSINKLPIIAEPCPKNIEKIVFPKKIQYKSDPQAKPLEKLLSEMIFTKDIEDNSRSNNDQLTISELQINYQKIVKYYKEWENKEAKEIRDWAEGKKNNLNNEDICEAIAVMDRANQLVTGGYRLRDTQILAVLSFLTTEENKGKLCQIQTGEGKTTIVSLLAVIKRLQGEKVDIITSNNVLAAEGVTAREDFYSLFGLTVATNNPDNNHRKNEDIVANSNSKKDQEGPRACYKADIVYGSINNFQFDYLKDSFLGYSTLAGREFGTVILDEVDSMLVDNGRHIAKLANPFPGMESLRYVYIKIWQELHKAEQELASDLNPNSMEVIKARIKAANPIDTDLIPKYLKAYAEKQLDKWIDNACYAKYFCHENQQYIIKSKNGEGVITPVDYMNTGVNLNNTVWPYGLHQFLQLKHNLPLTTETLTNSHVSNMHYIKKYGSKIFGMTGTLGSSAEKSLLSEIYNVDHTEIPTYKEKRFVELPGIIVQDIVQDSNWLDSIILGILEQINLSRAVLVICETIQDVKIIKQRLELFKSLDKNAINTIKTYVDEDDAKIIKDKVSCRDIIIATNIAGRGTDLETVEELNQYGGLHVCVTFLPSNQRVEDQAFGRTARQGNTGSGQLIIKESEVESLDIPKPLEDLKIDEVKYFRNQAEELRVQNILDKVIELDLQDELFHCFSNLYQELRENNKHIEGFHFVLEDLKEYWAFWLEQQEFKADNFPRLETIKQEKRLEQSSIIKAVAEQLFAKFTEEAKILIEGKNAYQDGIDTNGSIAERIIHNPHYTIKQAEYFLQKNNLRNDKLSKAEGALKQSDLLSDGEILPSSYMLLSELEIERSWHLVRKFTAILTAISKGAFTIKEPESSIANANYKDIAREHLEKAKKPLEKEIHYLREFFKINNDFDLILLPESSKDSNQDMLNHISLKASIVYKATDEDNFQLIYLKLKGYDQVIHKIYGIIELAKLLNEYQNDINNKLICISYYNTTIHILKENDHIRILYDDPLGNKMPYNIIWLFTKYCHNQQKQIDQVNQIEQVVKMLFLEQEQAIMPMERKSKKEDTTHSGNNKSNPEELLQKNLLLKHLYSKLVCLKIQQDNIDELITLLTSATENLIIKSKVSESAYLQKIDPNKEVINSVEIAELEHIGLGKIYGLNTIVEHTPTTFSNIEKQVGSGLSLLKTAEDFPFLSLLMKKVGYILITEGISNLINELMNHGESSLSCNQLFHLNAKIISEAIALIDEEPVSFIEKIIQYTINSYQQFIAQKNLPSVKSLYEELHDQQIAITQEFLDLDSEVIPYAAYQNQDSDQMQGQENEQDIGLIGCDEFV